MNFQVFTRSDISSEQDQDLPPSVPKEPPGSLEPTREPGHPCSSVLVGLVQPKAAEMQLL